MLYYAADTFFWYKALFMTELIIAELLLVFKLKPKDKLYIRIPAAILLCYGAAFALPCTSNVFISSFLFFILFIISGIAIYIVFKTKIKSALLVALFGYAVQHIANESYEIFLVGAGLVEGSSFNVSGEASGILGFFSVISYGSGQVSLGDSGIILVFYLMVYVIVYLMMFIVTHYLIVFESELEVKNGSLFIISLTTIVFGILSSTLVSWYSSDNLDKGYVIMLDLYNIICCIFVIYFLFNSMYVREMQNDLAVVNRLLDDQEKHYQIQKESINLINIKVHDLKHQIKLFKGQQYISDDQLKELEETISIYDSTIKTGNVALDVVLTEKSFECRNKKISFSCIADGEAINFFSETDIYSIFGNLLDNAIEATENLPEGHRVIGLTISKNKKGNFFHIYNKFSGDIKFRDGLPITTKEDKESHGFGMKSVSMLVEKYGGELLVKTEDDVFSVSAIFPFSK